MTVVAADADAAPTSSMPSSCVLVDASSTASAAVFDCDGRLLLVAIGSKIPGSSLRLHAVTNRRVTLTNQAANPTLVALEPGSAVPGAGELEHQAVQVVEVPFIDVVDHVAGQR